MVESNLNSVLPSLLALSMPKPVEGALERFLGIRDIRRVYGALTAAADNRPIAEKLLQFLEVTHSASPRDLDHIPRKGPAVMVVNHPFGILEGAVLATLISRVRSDVKFLANGILTAIPEIRIGNRKPSPIPNGTPPSQGCSKWPAGALRNWR